MRTMRGASGRLAPHSGRACSSSTRLRPLTPGAPRCARFHGPPVAVCLALNTGPCVSAWRPYAFLGLFPLHPLTLARYRDACTPRRAKADPTDAAPQRALLLTHRDTL